MLLLLLLLRFVRIYVLYIVHKSSLGKAIHEI